MASYSATSLFAKPPAVASATAKPAPYVRQPGVNNTDSFGREGAAAMAAPGTNAPSTPLQSAAAAVSNLLGNTVGRAVAPVGGSIGTPQPSSGGAGRAPAAAPIASGGIPAPQAADTYTPGALMQSQYRQAAPALEQTRALGQFAAGSGQAAMGQQNATAAGYNQAGQGFNASSQSVAPGFNIGQQVPATGGTAAPKALSTSQLGATPTIGKISGVAGQLGGVPQSAGVGNIAGQLGAGPRAAGVGGIAGQLGGAPQVGSIGGISGQLGAGPQVGNVGNIQMAQGPGAIAGQLGNMGAQSADQAGMMARLNGFLDSPEGPSVAESQLQQAQAGNMANLIGAARSGRGGAGASAQALRGAMSEGSAIMSDTAGQLATLRAQEADMLKNRQLSAIGLGGEMSTAARGQDLSFRGQDLQALQGDQSTALGSRGQDLQAAMANQGTQTALEQLRANTELGARGQNLSALQGDQSTALGLEGLRAQTALGARGQDLSALQGDQGTAAQMSLGQLQADVAGRGQNLSALQGDQATQAQMSLGNLQASLTGRGQNLSALQGDQSTALGREGLQAQTALAGRGQDLSLLQGNQATALGARGQDVTRDLGMANVNMGLRGQDAGVLMADADRNLAGQRLNLDAGLGYGSLANDATGQGLNYLAQSNQQALGAQGLTNDMIQSMAGNQTSLSNTDTAGRYGLQQQGLANSAGPSFGEQLALNVFGGLAGGAGQAAGAAALSDERAKTDITSLDSLAEHLRGAPGYRYRYKEGVGEDPSVEHAGPMAQDLERGPFGRALVKKGPDGLRRVDTSRLSLVNHAALAGMRSELDALKAQLEK